MMRAVTLACLLGLTGCPVEPVDYLEYELPQEECDAAHDASQGSPKVEDCGLWLDSTVQKARIRGIADLQHPDIRIFYNDHTSCIDAVYISTHLYYDKSWVHPIPILGDSSEN